VWPSVPENLNEGREDVLPFFAPNNSPGQAGRIPFVDFGNKVGTLMRSFMTIDAGAHINEADRFSVDPTCKPFLHYAVTDPLRKKEIAFIQ
jgi:hypothetical protein